VNDDASVDTARSGVRSLGIVSRRRCLTNAMQMVFKLFFVFPCQGGRFSES